MYNQQETHVIFNTREVRALYDNYNKDII